MKIFILILKSLNIYNFFNVYVKKIVKVVDSLFILPNVDIYLTGSNESMLSSEIATLLSGRYIEINILPFSFTEFKTAYFVTPLFQAVEKLLLQQ
ncbi:MAG: AAA family ATPase [Treponema sp.]|nr:AAA family ATPase [Treponema sp.]